MRPVVLALALALPAAACSRAATGPAWPKPHVADEDGGESLAPRPSAQAAAVEIESGDAVADAGEAVASPAAAATTPEPAAAPAQPPAPAAEEPMQTEDIIIEVNGDE